MIAWPPFAPDRARSAPGTTNRVLNVLPKAGSYGPVQAMQVYSDALPAACRGATTVRKLDGSFAVYAGTASKLYRLDGADWTEVGTGYTLEAGYFWSFVQWGSALVAADGVNDAPVVIDIEDSNDTFAGLGGSPPNGRHLWISGGHLCIGGLDELPMRFQRSGVQDIEAWTIGQRGSDINDEQTGGAITGGAGSQQGAYIFQQGRVSLMINQPGAQVGFIMQELQGARGCIAPSSIVQVGSMVFYLAEDGFYLLGGEGGAIGAETVNATFLADVDLDYIAEVQGVVDPISTCIYWRYKSTSSSSTTATDKILVFDWQLRKWSIIEAMVETLVLAATPGYTLEDLDAFGTLEELPYSLDSRVWQGGRPVLAAFDTDHKLNFFSGETMEAVLETGDLTLTPGRRTFVTGWRPIIDCGGVYGQVGIRHTYGGTTAWRPEWPQDVTGMVPARASGREHRFRLRIPAGTVWHDALGIEPSAVPEGTR